MAAVLAAGPGADAQPRQRRRVPGTSRQQRDDRGIGVTGRAGRIKRPGLRIHRPRTLRTHEVTTHDRITVTTPARTILALAATLQPHRLERLLDQAEILELTDYPALDAMAGAHPGHPGAGRLRRAWRDTRPA
jgi:hypothetical protein